MGRGDAITKHPFACNVNSRPGFVRSGCCHLYSDRSASKPALRQPEEGHAEEDRAAEGAGAQGEEEGRNGGEELGLAEIEAALGAADQQSWRQEGGEDGDRDQAEPVEEPLRQVALREDKEGEDAGEVGDDPHAEEEPEVVGVAHAATSRWRPRRLSR